MKEKNIVLVQKKARYIVHKLRRNCLLKCFIEGEIEGGITVTGRRGRRNKQQLYVVKEKNRYWKLKDEELESNLWRTGFGTG